jgi:hypothetical protein
MQSFSPVYRDYLIETPLPAPAGDIASWAKGAIALGRVDLLFKPEEGTDKVEKAQEVSGQFVKTRKYMSVLL